MKYIIDIFKAFFRRLSFGIRNPGEIRENYKSNLIGFLFKEPYISDKMIERLKEMFYGNK